MEAIFERSVAGRDTINRIVNHSKDDFHESTKENISLRRTSAI
ncbi:hypothetical protein [Methanolapillus millepedarum]